MQKPRWEGLAKNGKKPAADAVGTAIKKEGDLTTALCSEHTGLREGVIFEKPGIGLLREASRRGRNLRCVMGT